MNLVRSDQYHIGNRIIEVYIASETDHMRKEEIGMQLIEEGLEGTERNVNLEIDRSSSRIRSEERRCPY